MVIRWYRRFCGEVILVVDDAGFRFVFNLSMNIFDTIEVDNLGNRSHLPSRQDGD
jgi:hypothetical protein